MTHKVNKQNIATIFKDIQAKYCLAIEAADGERRFTKDIWQRDSDIGIHNGGGETRVLRDGAVFEQAGVNFSEVSGTLPADLTEKLINRDTKEQFYATGVSLVIHPKSPLVPTTHANVRYLEVGEYAWFGGGADLTPYYLFEEDATHFHSVLKNICDQCSLELYKKYKDWCDQYFYLPHRKEHRGIGGIFFDYLGKESSNDLAIGEKLTQLLGYSLAECYVPIVERRKNLAWTKEQKDFQLLRRGRYVEFNLIYDRGTLFGLKTGGRTESILMSLPPEVRWEYNFQAINGSKEEVLIQTVQNPRNWI